MTATLAVTPPAVRSVGPALSREAVRSRFPARQATLEWPLEECDRGEAMRLATAAPFVIPNAIVQAKRVRGLTHVLDWLQAQPGDTWQRRWDTSGAEAFGARWRQVPVAWLASRGRRSQWLPSELSSALSVLIFADVVRPSLSWLVSVPSIKSGLAAGLAQDRDPGGFAQLRKHCQDSTGITERAARLTAQRAAVILAAKGGVLADITVGDVLELLDTETDTLAAWPRDAPAFYQILHGLGILGDRHRTGSDSCARADS